MLIRTDGTLDFVRPKNRKDFKINELYSLLSCTIIQLIDLHDPELVMIIDENGKLKKNSVRNEKATKIYMEGRLSYTDGVEKLKEMYPGFAVISVDEGDGLTDVIVGDVLICKRSEIK